MIDARVTAADIARVTGIDAGTCEIWLAALKRHPGWADRLIPPYRSVAGSIAAAAAIGWHVVELFEGASGPQIACFVPRDHDDWSLRVADNAEMNEATEGGLLVVARRGLPAKLADLLSPTFAERPSPFGGLRYPRGTLMRGDYRPR